MRRVKRSVRGLSGLIVAGPMNDKPPRAGEPFPMRIDGCRSLEVCHVAGQVPCERALVELGVVAEVEVVESTQHTKNDSGNLAYKLAGHQAMVTSI